jgi:DNA polymerase-3 subunit chi
MTDRVDFYVLKSSTAAQRWTFACRLTEKAYLLDLRVVVWSDTAADAKLMDELLWTFNERAVVPHTVTGVASDDTAPVQLTPDLDSVAKADLLVNLSRRMPGGLERFSRIAEILDADDERRRLGRARFKAYRDLKLLLETHQMDEAADA